MATRTTEPPQAESNIPPPPPGPGPGPPDHQASSRAGNKVFKTGPLFLSSKGIGWTSWKKRWFILTGTSLVFFRSDPSAVPQKGGEVNLTLGGIDLNNSGSVVVKADKKLLTVAFADGRDGRAFTLKAETLEDLYEWKTALENALAQAPSATLVMGQNGLLRNDQAAPADGSTEQLNDKQQAVKSMIIGRPILLALEEVDGSPSFLEKALRFIEEHGVKVEGILRQAADVDDVEHRVREYEQGKVEFTPDEDPHVIGDCIKYILREMPSSPVPASCCNALLEACRVDRERRVNAMRTAICETFPEPNRRLLQRILTMMQTVASHKAENRMSSSAVAACMAPLLLRPLLAGDCELENDFDVGGDGSMQLLQAAAAANHAQAIVITLLEEYENIFGEGSMSTDLYSDSEGSGSESGEATDYYDDDDESYDEEEPDDGSEGSEIYTDEGSEDVSVGSGSRSYDDDEGSTHSGKSDGESSTSGSHHSSEATDRFEENDLPLPTVHQTSPVKNVQSRDIDNLVSRQGSISPEEQKSNPSTEILRDNTPETNQVGDSAPHTAICSMSKSTTIASGQILSARRPAVWGRTPAKKNLSMESIDISFDEEAEIEKLEDEKEDLKIRIDEEAKANAVLRGNLQTQKNSLHERRQALEQEVARLQEQLQKEKDLRRALEAAVGEPRGSITCPPNIDEKTKADLEDIAKTAADINNLKQKVDDLGEQINIQREENLASTQDTGSQPQQCGASKDNQTKNAHTPCPPEKSKSRKGSSSDGTKTAKEKRMESSSSSKKHQPPNQKKELDSSRSGKQKQLDSSRSGKSRRNEQSASSAAASSLLGKPLSSKKSGARGEGTNSTASALSKLTNRLNFLKERRSQIANDLQSMDKSRGSEKAQGQEKETGSGSCNPEEKRGTEDTPSNPEKSRNPDPPEELNKGTEPEQSQYPSQSTTDRSKKPPISSRTDSRSS